MEGDFYVDSLEDIFLAERWRFLVVPRYAIQELVESRVLMVFVVLWGLVRGELAERTLHYALLLPGPRAAGGAGRRHSTV